MVCGVAHGHFRGFVQFHNSSSELRLFRSFAGEIQTPARPPMGRIPLSKFFTTGRASTITYRQHTEYSNMMPPPTGRHPKKPRYHHGGIPGLSHRMPIENPLYPNVISKFPMLRTSLLFPMASDGFPAMYRDGKKFSAIGQPDISPAFYEKIPLTKFFTTAGRPISPTGNIRNIPM